MMKLIPRGYREDSTMRQGGQIVVEMPQWVSNMGLEWLHELVLRAEELGRTKASRQG